MTGVRNFPLAQCGRENSLVETFNNATHRKARRIERLLASCGVLHLLPSPQRFVYAPLRRERGAGHLCIDPRLVEHKG